MITINTGSGGQINLGLTNHTFNGVQAYIHIDQSSNIKNGDGDASIVVSLSELRELKEKLNLL